MLFLLYNHHHSNFLPNIVLALLMFSTLSKFHFFLNKILFTHSCMLFVKFHTIESGKYSKEKRKISH